MTNDVPDDLLEIRDPEIDAAALMAQIRDRIQKRRETLGVDNRIFESFDVTPCPEPPEGAHDVHLYHHLRRANEVYAYFETEPVLSPSALARLPIVGAWWQHLRPALHELVLIYVNRLAAQQININRHFVSVLNQLTVQVRQQQEQIAALEAEVQALRREQR